MNHAIDNPTSSSTDPRPTPPCVATRRCETADNWRFAPVPIDPLVRKVGYLVSFFSSTVHESVSSRPVSWEVLSRHM